MQMARLFYRDEWFYELSPTALGEIEFEEILIQNSDVIHGNSTIVPFKKTIYSADASARPDLAIVDKDYKHWMVVEVEMIRHSLHAHVIPQIRTMREASYDQEDATFLASQNPNLQEDKLRDMLRGDAPEVLVIANKHDEEWARELRRYGAYMMVFEIFRSRLNRHIFSVNGELPQAAADVVTELSFGFLPRCLAVSAPAALPFRAGDRFEIFIGGQLTQWERFDTATECYISPIGNMPIKPGKTYALFRLSDGRYSIRLLR